MLFLSLFRVRHMHVASETVPFGLPRNAAHLLWWSGQQWEGFSIH